MRKWEEKWPLPLGGQYSTIAVQGSPKVVERRKRTGSGIPKQTGSNTFPVGVPSGGSLGPCTYLGGWGLTCALDVIPNIVHPWTVREDDRHQGESQEGKPESQNRSSPGLEKRDVQPRWLLGRACRRCEKRDERPIHPVTEWSSKPPIKCWFVIDGHHARGPSTAGISTNMVQTKRKERPPETSENERIRTPFLRRLRRGPLRWGRRRENGDSVGFLTFDPSRLPSDGFAGSGQPEK